MTIRIAAVLCILLPIALIAGQTSPELQKSDDEHADVAEKEPASLANGPADALTDAALNRTMVPYFGASVRAAYIQQPATAVVRLAEVQQMQFTGSGVIAVIDTGVDPDRKSTRLNSS